ncbi:MAG: phytanoyl-CoA dioxygenase family protein [Planctomycetota bacterium]|nr:MAG: phytanoyl-CoA dioxygenase family protein [Planctomycetota bacterium]
MSLSLFTSDELARFERDGFIVIRQLAPRDQLLRMREITREGLDRVIPPVEFEAELHYPGAPNSLDAEGGRTVRRLKQAMTRDHVFLQWVTFPGVLGRLKQLLGPRVVCPLAHHNCIMTKEPRFSSETGWHQDIRYWSFTRPELVNVWLALGNERPENGCLKVIPGTHRLTYDREQFDNELFLREDLPRNAPLFERVQYVALEPGDVLFFHCLTFHAADRNQTQETKTSVVFTFRPEDNPPRPDSRSSESPEMLLP